MIEDPDCAVETDHHTDDEKGRGDYPERVFVRESNGDDGSGKFPRGGVEGIGEPVGYQGIDGPFPVARTNGIEIWMWLVRSALLKEWLETKRKRVFSRGGGV